MTCIPESRRIMFSIALIKINTSFLQDPEV
jgi:hypothetical protein